MTRGRAGRRIGRELPRGPEKARAVQGMFDAIAPRYDLLNRVLTFGLDALWRRKTVTLLGLPRGSSVVDVACGTGDLCRNLIEAGHDPIGIDFAYEMLAHANGRYRLAQADALALPFRDHSVDGATCGFALRNVVDLASLFAELARVIRPHGRISLLEVSEPSWQPARAAHAVYFRRVVPLVGGWLSDRDAYAYLPRSTAYLPATRDLLGMIAGTGFTGVERNVVGAGAAQIITATRA